MDEIEKLLQEKRARQSAHISISTIGLPQAEANMSFSDVVEINKMTETIARLVVKEIVEQVLKKYDFNLDELSAIKRELWQSIKARAQVDWSITPYTR